MSDEQTPRSGSRWEPTPDTQTVAQPSPPPVPPAASASPAPAPGTSAATGRSWTERLRGNAGLAGGALALVLVGGFGGFAVANTTNGPDHFGLVGDQAPGGGFPAPGTGQPPPPRHGDDDDDGDGFGTPGGSDDDDAATESGSTR